MRVGEGRGVGVGGLLCQRGGDDLDEPRITRGRGEAQGVKAVPLTVRIGTSSEQSAHYSAPSCGLTTTASNAAKTAAKKR